MADSARMGSMAQVPHEILNGGSLSLVINHIIFTYTLSSDPSKRIGGAHRDSSKSQPARRREGGEADHGRKHEIIARRELAAGDLDQPGVDEGGKPAENCDPE